ncbi:MAG: aspartate aminotransferase family protein [Rhodothermales bacterium]|nr:aspartate aminotransferase family protein [Rhodothermales bacterium]
MTLTHTERALRVFPAGSNGEFNIPDGMGIVIDRGEGCSLWDTEGRHFYDFSMGWGSALVGHARPEVVEAVVRQAARGSNFAYVTEASLELGEELVRLSPACDQIRFCASGTEATMYILRLARAFTGRKKILKFEGAYHGANDVGVTSLFPQKLQAFPTPEPSSAGVDHAVQDHVLIAPYNDLATTERLIDAYAGELAGVIVEPLHRCLPPAAGFLQGLRDATQRYGIPLLFDEVVTGFRFAYGGAQEYYGVVPDLVAYGKALGGGYPIGAYGGRADIMALVREDGLGYSDRYVWTASTLGGNPISTTAASAALEVFRADGGVYPELHRMGVYLRAGMRRVLETRGIPGQIIGDGPLAQVVFTAETEPVRDYRATRRGDSARSRATMLGLFERGIFLNPMGTKLYLSIAHDEAVCDAFLDRFDDTVGALTR